MLMPCNTKQCYGKFENNEILSLPKIHFQLPWIAEFIMESGWAQEILSDLSKVHRGGLEIGVKAAFDDLLSSLVASGGQDVIDEFQKNGAIQVCQTHTLKELARAVANEAVKNNRNK